VLHGHGPRLRSPREAKRCPEVVELYLHHHACHGDVEERSLDAAIVKLDAAVGQAPHA